jgi:hypothetical protein
MQAAAAAALTAQLIRELIVDVAVDEHRLALLRRERCVRFTL